VRGGLVAKARAGAIPKRAVTRKGRQRVARHAPDGGVDRRGSPGGGDTFRRTANRATAPARERVRSSVGACPRVVIQVADFALVRRCRSHAERRTVRLARGRQLRRRRKTRRGSFCGRTRRFGAEEGVSDRGKPFSSRGAVKAVSILRPPRKLSCKGGSVTRRVTGCQRRSRVRSETTRFSEGQNPRETRAPVTTRPRCRTARRSGSSTS